MIGEERTKNLTKVKVKRELTAHAAGREVNTLTIEY